VQAETEWRLSVYMIHPSSSHWIRLLKQNDDCRLIWIILPLHIGYVKYFFCYVHTETEWHLSLYINHPSSTLWIRLILFLLCAYWNRVTSVTLYELSFLFTLDTVNTSSVMCMLKQSDVCHFILIILPLHISLVLTFELLSFGIPKQPVTIHARTHWTGDRPNPCLHRATQQTGRAVFWFWFRLSWLGSASGCVP
jgi:hypothetical protein